ncbi:MAG TPA: GNAT family N-acetyltransferase [Lacipirellulaceae bacterium]|jgi:RimJ/RimL family protein N-acetyltransferase
MTFPERIQTKRLLVRRPTEDDADEIFARYASDELVTKYLTWAPHKSVEDTIAYLEKRRNDDRIFNWLVFLAETGQLLGSIGCSIDGHIVQFGYCYARDAWGRAYATEAAGAMVQIWMSDPTVWRVQAFCDPRNVASARVLEKAGLTFEGTLRKHAMSPNVSDVPCDARCYAIVRQTR